jgi:hypothetical protein
VVIVMLIHLALFQAPPGPLNVFSLLLKGPQARRKTLVRARKARPDARLPVGPQPGPSSRGSSDSSLRGALPHSRGPLRPLPRPPQASTACTLIRFPNWPWCAWRVWPLSPSRYRPGGGRTALGLMHASGRRLETGGRSEPLVAGGSLGPVVLLVFCVLSRCWVRSSCALGLFPLCPSCSCRGIRWRSPLENQRGAVHKSPRSLARGLAARFLACRPCLPSGPPQSATGGVQPSLGLKTWQLHVREPDCARAGPRVVPARLWPAARSWVLLLALFVVPARFAPVSSGARPCMPCWCPGGPRALWEAPFCTRPCARALGPSLGSQVQRAGPKVFGQASPCRPLAFRPA